jgi:hypothetical protein
MHQPAIAGRHTRSGVRQSMPRRRLGRHTKAYRGEWIVTDDWPEDVPVTDTEVDVFEAWFGELLDELFSPRH